MADTAVNNIQRSISASGRLDPAFFACLFYYFIEYFRPHQKYAIFKGIPFGDIAAGLFILFFILSGRKLEVKNKINVLVGLYFLWIVICSITGFNFSASWDFIIYFLKFFLIYFLTINTITDEKQLIWFIFFIGLLYFSYTNYALRGWIFAGFSGGVRGSYYGAGFFHNPNDMSAALSSFFGLSLYMIFADKYKLFNKFPNKWFHLVNTALIVIGILLTSTRGGAVALAACMLYFWKKKRFQVKYFFILVLISLSFASMLSEAQIEKFERIGTERDESTQARLDNWAVAWKMMNDYPVFGVGPGNYVRAKQEVYYETENLFVQHNIFLQASTELGYPGLIILLFLIYCFYRNTREVKRLCTDSGPEVYSSISHGLEISMLGFIVSGLFITTLYYPFFWLNLAFIVSLRNIASKNIQSEA